MLVEVPFKSYPNLRLVSVIAGLLGTFQALAWMALSILGILAYYGHVSFDGAGRNFGNLLRFTIFQMYFRGENLPAGWPPNVNFDVLNELNLMEPWVVNIWMWVIAPLSLLWLFASVALLTSVKKTNLRSVNVFLFIWIFITFIVIIIDLVLFVLFILDYIDVMQLSYQRELDFAASNLAVLITAQNTAGIMASVALRGYLLWLINIFLVVFLFGKTFYVYDYNKIKPHGSGEVVKQQQFGQINPAFAAAKNDELSGHSIFHNQPIQAFNDPPAAPWYNYLTKDIPRVHRHSQYPPPQLVRSNSASKLDSSRPVHQRQSSVESDVVLRREQVQQELKYRQSLNSNTTPEYRPPLKSALRSTRY